MFSLQVHNCQNYQFIIKIILTNMILITDNNNQNNKNQLQQLDYGCVKQEPFYFVDPTIWNVLSLSLHLYFQCSCHFYKHFSSSISLKTVDTPRLLTLPCLLCHLDFLSYLCFFFQTCLVFHPFTMFEDSIVIGMYNNHLLLTFKEILF